MTFFRDTYEAAVQKTHQTHQVGEHLVWRTPKFHPELRFVFYSAVLVLGILFFGVVLQSMLVAQVWGLAAIFIGIWRILTPILRLPLGYTVTSKRLIVFRLYGAMFGSSQRSYPLENYLPPVVEPHLLLKNHGDLRFDLAKQNKSPRTESLAVGALLGVFDSVRIRDVKNPIAVAELILSDKSIKWGASA